MSLCPCGTGSPYSECCEPLIRGERPASTAEALMRARFSAYTKKEVDFIYRTIHPEQQKKADRESIKTWADVANFRTLDVLKVEEGGAGDDSGMVEFIAMYEEGGEERRHHEHARFERVGGEWFFDQHRSAAPALARATPDIGRNDPCPCGSGKKYKKCCGP